MQSGFTLVEMLLAVLLLVSVLAAVAVFERSFLQRELGLYETSTLTQRRADLSEALRGDFAQAGWGLTVAAPAQGAAALPLPFDRNWSGQRLVGAVTIDPSGSRVTLLNGAPATDVAYLTQEISGSTPGQVCMKGVYRTRSDGTSYQAGEFVMLEDFSGFGCAAGISGCSALYQVTSTPGAPDDAHNVCMILSGATSGAAAWGRLYSDTDFQHTFPAGSRVVKLQAPVDWQLNGSMLYRRTGNGAYNLGGFQVQQFSVAQLSNTGGYGYVISLALVAEGVEAASNPGNAAASSPITLTVFPRALNLGYNPQD
jgi:prepilin-type N-terminal cleavage/methylation domain-containing protein